MAVGTVAYAAPEQLMGERADGRVDEYALAATAFHLLTGTPCFQHSNLPIAISQHLRAPPAIVPWAARPDRLPPKARAKLSIIATTPAWSCFSALREAAGNRGWPELVDRPTAFSCVRTEASIRSRRAVNEPSKARWKNSLSRSVVALLLVVMAIALILLL